jgi:hypothetical protein
MTQAELDLYGLMEAAAKAAKRDSSLYMKHWSERGLFLRRYRHMTFIRRWYERDQRVDRHIFTVGGARVVVDAFVGKVDGIMTLRSVRLTRGQESDLVLAALL